MEYCTSLYTQNSRHCAPQRFGYMYIQTSQPIGSMENALVCNYIPWTP